MIEYSSLYRKNLQQAIIAENSVWDELAKYFPKRYITNEYLATGDPIYKICDFPGVLSYMVSTNLIATVEVAEFFAFETTNEPQVPTELKPIEYPIIWSNYYKKAWQHHTARINLLKAVVDIVTANIPVRVQEKINTTTA